MKDERFKACDTSWLGQGFTDRVNILLHTVHRARTLSNWVNYGQRWMSYSVCRSYRHNQRRVGKVAENYVHLSRGWQSKRHAVRAKQVDTATSCEEQKCPWHQRFDSSIWTGEDNIYDSTLYLKGIPHNRLMIVALLVLTKAIQPWKWKKRVFERFWDRW